MVADRHQRAAVARAHQVGDEEVADQHIGEHDVEILPGRRAACSRRSRTGWRWPHRAAGEPLGAGEEVEQDILRGQGRDHEIEPLQPRRRHAEDQPDQCRDHARERNREKDRDREVVVDVGRGERAEQEEGGVADRDLPGEADQDVQAQRCDREDADLDRDREPVFAEGTLARNTTGTMPRIANCGSSSSERSWCPPS